MIMPKARSELITAISRTKQFMILVKKAGKSKYIII